MKKLNLKILRQEIDIIDKQIIMLLSRRFSVVEKIGKTKKLLDLKMIDPKRHAEMLKKRVILGEKYKMPDKLINNIWELIHSHAVKIQSKNL